MEVNGKEFHSFVDSGAQSTIMSKAFAEKCGLLKNVDMRY
jgi:predicted aspartyl protease